MHKVYEGKLYIFFYFEGDWNIQKKIHLHSNGNTSEMSMSSMWNEMSLIVLEGDYEIAKFWRFNQVSSNEKCISFAEKRRSSNAHGSQDSHDQPTHDVTSFEAHGPVFSV